MIEHLRFAQGLPVFQDHDRPADLAPFFVGDADDGGFRHRGSSKMAFSTSAG